jgi:hypothetical protein
MRSRARGLERENREGELQGRIERKDGEGEQQGRTARENSRWLAEETA